MRPLEGGSGHRVNVVAAPGAGIRGQFAELREVTLLPTFGAFDCLSEPHNHQMFQARVIVWKLGEKLVNGHWLHGDNLL
jgi:hypothetical protein